MEHADRPAVVVARIVIAHLRQSVQAWMDEDRVLPADGSSLLAALDRALAGPNDENAWAAQIGTEAFINWAQARIDAGVLAAADGRPRIAVAAALGALLRSADGAGSGDTNTS
jgi:hypothetical protein